MNQRTLCDTRKFYHVAISVEPHRRVSYSQGQHMFHCLVASGITFVCMAEEV